MSDEQQQHWFAGLPVTGSRTLSDEELREINARLTRPAIRQKYLIPLIVVAAAILLLGVYGGYFRDFPRLINVAIVIALSVALREKVNSDQALRHDVDTGHVVICSGDSRQLVSAIGQQTGESPVTIEVLPRSAILWTVDGRRVEKWRRVHRSTTMAIPQHARMAANFVRPIDGVEDVLAHERMLSDAEVDEIIAIKPPFPLKRIAGAAVLLTAVIFFVVVGTREQLLGMKVMAVIVAAIDAYVIVRIVRFVRFRRTLQRDIDHRRVLIIRRREEGDLGPANEYLPHTNIPWTEDGEPVAWRKLRS